MRRTLDGEPEYIHPPPDYAPIVGRITLENGVSDNLMRVFVDMQAEEVGKVMPDLEFWSWVSTASDESSGSANNSIDNF